MDDLIELDQELFFALNGLNTPWLDQPVYFITDTWAWVPLYAWMLFVIWKYRRNDVLVILLAITVTIVIADQVTSSVMKPMFERLRPSRDPAIADMVHVVNGYRGGKYGFASSHAANTFGVSLLFFLFFRRTLRYAGLIFVWAFIVSATRVYLGVHYPGDIIGGALVGMAAGLASYYLAERVNSRRARISAGGEGA